MLLANWFVETIGRGFGTLAAVLCVLLWCAKKFADSNPEVKDTAKKAASAKAIQLIARLFK
jgi:hypothetical protein